MDLQTLTGQASDRARTNVVEKEVSRRRIVKVIGGTGIYIGYDASAGAAGLHTIKIIGDRGLEVVQGQFISNAGVAPGDKVVWTPGGVGGVYSLKTMPR